MLLRRTVRCSGLVGQSPEGLRCRRTLSRLQRKRGRELRRGFTAQQLAGPLWLLVAGLVEADTGTRTQFTSGPEAPDPFLRNRTENGRQ